MDLFGDALRDLQAGQLGKTLTIRRDDGHTDSHGPEIYFTEIPFAFESELLATAKGPVLDVGCGAGRTLLWLEQQGIEATGIDLSPGAVDVAGKRGCSDVRQGNIMEDGLDVLAGKTFQTAILFGNNVGIGGTLEGATELLRRIAGVMRPKGQLLVTGLNIAQTGDPRHLAYHSANLSKGRPRGEIEMRFEYEGKVDDWVPWFHPEPNELESMAQEAGWLGPKIGNNSELFFSATLQKP